MCVAANCLGNLKNGGGLAMKEIDSHPIQGREGGTGGGGGGSNPSK